MKNPKRLIKACLATCAFLGIFVFSLNAVKAQNDVGASAPGAQATGLELFVNNVKGNFILAQQKIIQWENWISNKFGWLKTLKEFADKHLGARYWKQALGYFLNQMAYDTANYLATGNHGQGPMFETRPFSRIISDAADGAAGQFLNDLANGISKDILGWNTKWNVCSPNISVKIRIALGVNQRFKKPECTFSQLTKNWENAITKQDFLNNFQNMFNPGENDLSTALIINQNLNETLNKKMNDAEKTYLNGPFKDVTNAITGAIKLPGSLVRTRAEKTIYNADKKETTPTDDILADAIDTFFSTLIGRIFQKWFTEGLVDNMPPAPQINLPDVDTNVNGGIAAARERFRTLIEPQFGILADYSIVAELTNCENPDKAGPSNCVITQKFGQAIGNRLTVGQAITEGYLNAGGKFGFVAGGAGAAEPKYMDESYPYRSMMILRKYRILPVGWEVAAQYISAHSEIGSCTLGDMVSCFDEKIDTYNGLRSGNCKMDTKWCRGLVDPNWVLKAPLNYCRKQGYGPEITNTVTSGTGADSMYAVDRKDGYCADEQSCIKENFDGSCQIYGYCSQEKRTWNFNSTACSPINNTCRTFRKSDGSTVSYLQNTLDNAGCTAATSGCRKYCLPSSGAVGGWECGLGKEIYLNKSAKDCSSEGEGCHEFIRVKEGQGANLLTNSGFENDLTNDDWATYGDSVTEPSAQGVKSLKLKGSSMIREIKAGPSNYELAGRSLTLSFYARKCGQGGKFGFIDLSDSALMLRSSVLNTNDSWQKFVISYTFPNNYGFRENRGNYFKFGLTGYTSSCLIDAVKVESGLTATEYSDYRGRGLVYEKLLPDYLESRCYIDAPGYDYRLKTDAPDDCKKFARKCNYEEVGCGLYTSERTGSSIPASVVQADYCPAECNGYDQYIQKETPFESKQDEYFIPSSAKTCSVQEAGCDEFTNLDEIAKKGEERQYYTYLRQCIKPADSKANCGEFYTWEGSDESGYQLKVFNLQLDSDPKIGGKDNGAFDDNGKDCNQDGAVTSDECVYLNDPAITFDDRDTCNEAIYKLTPDSGSYNSSCRQFYNRQGDISYHIFNNTISCTENCHPFRKSDNNLLFSQASCTNECRNEYGTDSPDSTSACTCSVSCSDRSSDGKAACSLGEGQWVYCKGHGKWSVDHQACLYSAASDEGVSCSKISSGCREYSGNWGSNVRNILVASFDSDQGATGWTGLDSNATISNVSIRAGGKSLYITKTVSSDTEIYHQPTVSVNIPNLNNNSSYNLSFLAKTNTSKKISIILKGKDGNTSLKEFPASGTDWKLYTINVQKLSGSRGEDSIIFSSESDFYLDDVKLIEISDRYYLIKNSWVTPITCDNTLDEPGGRDSCYDHRCAPQEMVGCSKYSDRDGKIVYLKSFNKLCQESAVGCEMMIDTKNSVKPTGRTWKNGKEESCDPTKDKDCVDNQADNFIYAVYNDSYKCNNSDKGCQKFGQAHTYDSQSVYEEKYKINNPDAYSDTLCSSGAEGCDEWTLDNALNYFRDPGDQVCEWKEVNDPSTDLVKTAWWKRQVKKCDVDNNGKIAANEGSYCRQDADCGSQKCLDDANYYLCPTDNQLTIGYGGVPVDQPKKPWVGICPSSESGCSEYIDPVSRPATSIVFNGNFNDLDKNKTFADGWESGASGWLYQKINLTPYALYIIHWDAPQAGSATNIAGIECPSIHEPGYQVFELTSDSKFTLRSGANLDVSITNGQSKAFYIMPPASGYGNPETCQVKVNSNYAKNNNQIQVKKALINYQIDSKIDSTGCNGQVDFERGCVLFNERTLTQPDTGNNNSGYSNLIWDADLTSVNDKNGISPLAGDIINRDANKIIKVTPDRSCDKWLACRSSVVTKNENGKDQTICFDIASCNSFDESGNCNGFVNNVANQNQEVIPDGTTALQYLNSSGYSIVGLEASGQQDSAAEMKGYLPLGSMKQVGEMTLVPNGNFEIYGSNYYPIGWLPKDKTSWNVGLFSVINNPYTAASEGGVSRRGGIAYPLEGASLLKYSSEDSDKTPLSESIEVEQNKDYVLSYWVNTLDLKNKNGGSYVVSHIDVESNDGKIIKSSEQILGLNWAQKILAFNSGANRSIYLHLGSGSVNAGKFTACHSGGDCSGNIYIDDIKITPNLQVRDDWKVAQSCRLYPESNSLSCDYFNDTGTREKGLWGYCLEHDRYPGSPNACLMWWPIDKVKGDGIEEGAGYNGSFPLYYCLEAKGVCGGASGLIPQYQCTKLVQVVTPAGQNKYWSSRVYKGSLYEVPFADRTSNRYIEYLDYDPSDEQGSLMNGKTKKAKDMVTLNYLRDNPPFGSVAIPSSYPAANPYEWTGTTGGAGSSTPLLVDLSAENKDSARAGTPYYGTGVTCSRTESTKYSKFYKSIFTRADSGGDPVKCPPKGSENGYCLFCPSGYTGKNVKDCGEGKSHSAEPIKDPNGNIIGCEAYEDKGNNGYQCCELTCEASYVYNMANTVSEARGGLMDLFAQSYGGWTWTESGKCIGGSQDGVAKTNCTDDCPEGNCVPSNKTVCTNSSNNGDECATATCSSGQSCVSEALVLTTGYKCGGNGYSCCSNSAKVLSISNPDKNTTSGCSNNQPCSKYTADASSKYYGMYFCDAKPDPTKAGENRCCPNSKSCFVCNDANYKPSYSDGKIIDTNQCTGSVQCQAVQQRQYTGLHKCLPNNSDPNNPKYGSTCCMGSGTKCEKGNVCDKGPKAGGYCQKDDCPGGSCDIKGGYRYDNSYSKWYPPQNICVNPSGYPVQRSEVNKDADYCSVPPKIKNIQVNNKTKTDIDVKISKNGYANLTFNSEVDSQQLPMTMIAVDWGDGEQTVISGVEMRDRRSGTPHSLFHLYDYWDLRTKSITSPNSKIDCSTSGQCRVTPRIKIKDNWGWCSWRVDDKGEYDGVPTWNDNCNDISYQSYGRPIIVTEK